jgi:hypothetical protein
MKTALLLSLLYLASCSMFSSNENGAYVKSKNYINQLEKSIPSTWSRLTDDGADFALMNKKSSSIFLINSACRKNETSSLNALSSSLITGIADIEIIDRKNIDFQGREAQEIKFSGKVDGVKSYVNILTTQKNYCIYDFVLISKSIKKLEQDYINFKEFISRVTLE